MTEQTPSGAVWPCEMAVERVWRLLNGHNGGFNHDDVRYVCREIASLLAADHPPHIDDPRCDATDAAHPAWWRGQEHSVLVLCKEINEILDGKPIIGTSSEPWESVRRRLAGLAAGPSSDAIRESLSLLLSFTGQFTPEEFVDAYLAKNTPGHELVDRDKMIADFLKCVQSGWAALSDTPR